MWHWITIKNAGAILDNNSIISQLCDFVRLFNVCAFASKDEKQK